MVYQANKEGAHGTIHIRTIERPACGAWVDAGTACGAEHLSKSALGSYEAEDFKDISHALIKLAKFYGVTADYLLGLSETKNHPNADLADLRLSDDMIEPLKSGLKKDNPGLTDPQLRQLVAAHSGEDSFCRYVIQQDINGIALDLWEAHRDDFSASRSKRRWLLSANGSG